MNSAAARITRGAIALLSVFGLFFGATAIANAAPAKPPKPPIEKVAICQYNTYTSAWELASVKTSVADKLVARGVAAYPLQPVPGTDGAYVFDATCVPQLVTPITITVTYSGNEATGGSVPSAGTGDYSTVYTVASNSGGLVRTGYTFAGWNTAADGTGTTYVAGSGSFTLISDVTLYAKWTPVKTLFAVAYSDRDTTDGAYNPDVDVLIAKLVDGNNDGILNAGDKVITNKIPKWYDITNWDTDFGAFNVTEQIITGSYGCDAVRCDVYKTIETAPNTFTEWGFTFYHSGTYGEFYSEAVPFAAGSTFIQDNLGGAWADKLEIYPYSPSQPDFQMNGDRPYYPTDEAFVDVDIY